MRQQTASVPAGSFREGVHFAPPPSPSPSPSPSPYGPQSAGMGYQPGYDAEVDVAGGEKRPFTSGDGRWFLPHCSGHALEGRVSAAPKKKDRLVLEFALPGGGVKKFYQCNFCRDEKGIQEWVFHKNYVHQHIPRHHKNHCRLCQWCEQLIFEEVFDTHTKTCEKRGKVVKSQTGRRKRVQVHPHYHQQQQHMDNTPMSMLTTAGPQSPQGSQYSGVGSPTPYQQQQQSYSPQPNYESAVQHRQFIAQQALGSHDSPAPFVFGEALALPPSLNMSGDTAPDSQQTQTANFGSQPTAHFGLYPNGNGGDQPLSPPTSPLPPPPPYPRVSNPYHYSNINMQQQQQQEAATPPPSMIAGPAYGVPAGQAQPSHPPTPSPEPPSFMQRLASQFSRMVPGHTQSSPARPPSLDQAVTPDPSASATAGQLQQDRVTVKQESGGSDYGPHGTMSVAMPLPVSMSMPMGTTFDTGLLKSQSGSSLQLGFDNEAGLPSIPEHDYGEGIQMDGTGPGLTLSLSLQTPRDNDMDADALPAAPHESDYLGGGVASSSVDYGYMGGGGMGEAMGGPNALAQEPWPWEGQLDTADIVKREAADKRGLTTSMQDVLPGAKRQRVQSVAEEEDSVSGSVDSSTDKGHRSNRYSDKTYETVEIRSPFSQNSAAATATQRGTPPFGGQPGSMLAVPPTPYDLGAPVGSTSGSVASFPAGAVLPTNQVQLSESLLQQIRESGNAVELLKERFDIDSEVDLDALLMYLLSESTAVPQPPNRGLGPGSGVGDTAYWHPVVSHLSQDDFSRGMCIGMDARGLVSFDTTTAGQTIGLVPEISRVAEQRDWFCCKISTSAVDSTAVVGKEEPTIKKEKDGGEKAGQEGTTGKQRMRSPMGAVKALGSSISRSGSSPKAAYESIPTLRRQSNTNESLQRSLSIPPNHSHVLVCLYGRQLAKVAYGVQPSPGDFLVPSGDNDGLWRIRDAGPALNRSLTSPGQIKEDTKKAAGDSDDDLKGGAAGASASADDLLEKSVRKGGQLNGTISSVRVVSSRMTADSCVEVEVVMNQPLIQSLLSEILEYVKATKPKDGVDTLTSEGVLGSPTSLERLYASLERLHAALPAKLFVPPPYDKLVGRSRELQAISEVYRRQEAVHGATPLLRVVQLCGLPGVGKTCVAVAYCHHYLRASEPATVVSTDAPRPQTSGSATSTSASTATGGDLVQLVKRDIHGSGGGGGGSQDFSEYDLILWLNGESREDLRKSYRRLARDLNLYLENQDLTEDQVAAALKMELLRSSQRGIRWLVVLDGLDETALAVDDIVPTNARGHVLITARVPRLQYAQRGQCLEIESLTLQDAANILIRAIQPPPALALTTADTSDRDESSPPTTPHRRLPKSEIVAARKLAEAVGCLPIQLAHIEAFFRAGGELGLTYDEFYQRWFVENNPDLQEAFNTFVARTLDEEPASVAMVATYESLSKQSQAGGRIAEMLAYWAPSPVGFPKWEELFNAMVGVSPRVHDNGWSPFLDDPNPNREKWLRRFQRIFTIILLLLAFVFGIRSAMLSWESLKESLPKPWQQYLVAAVLGLVIVGLMLLGAYYLSRMPFSFLRRLCLRNQPKVNPKERILFVVDVGFDARGRLPTQYCEYIESGADCSGCGRHIDLKQPHASIFSCVQCDGFMLCRKCYYSERFRKHKIPTPCLSNEASNVASPGSPLGSQLTATDECETTGHCCGGWWIALYHRGPKEQLVGESAPREEEEEVLSVWGILKTHGILKLDMADKTGRVHPFFQKALRDHLAHEAEVTLSWEAKRKIRTSLFTSMWILQRLMTRDNRSSRPADPSQREHLAAMNPHIDHVARYMERCKLMRKGLFRRYVIQKKWAGEPEPEDVAVDVSLRGMPTGDLEVKQVVSGVTSPSLDSQGGEQGQSNPDSDLQVQNSKLNVSLCAMAGSPQLSGHSRVFPSVSFLSNMSGLGDMFPPSATDLLASLPAARTTANSGPFYIDSTSPDKGGRRVVRVKDVGGTPSFGMPSDIMTSSHRVFMSSPDTYKSASGRRTAMNPRMKLEVPSSLSGHQQQQQVQGRVSDGRFRVYESLLEAFEKRGDRDKARHHTAPAPEPSPSPSLSSAAEALVDRTVVKIMESPRTPHQEGEP